MVKKKLMSPSHVLIFVEGDTDEVFFRALIDYYASVSSCKLLPYDVCNLKGVTRYSSKLLAKLKNEYLPTAKTNGYGICSYLRLKQIPSSLKGINGYQKMLDLYNKAHRTYKKGYETKELINVLDMSVIRKKRQDALMPLEESLGVASV